jgi:DNA-binding MarR family transcriptional regulator
MGYAEFRRSDTAILRRLRVGPAAFVELADVVHVSRQAIRKFIEGLDTRGYVSIVRDEGDARRSMVSLTSSGEKYADAVIDVARTLHSEVARVVDSADMATAVGVLATVTDKWAAGVS